MSRVAHLLPEALLLVPNGPTCWGAFLGSCCCWLLYRSDAAAEMQCGAVGAPRRMMTFAEYNLSLAEQLPG